MNKKLLNRAATLKLKYLKLAAQRADILCTCEKYLTYLTTQPQTNTTKYANLRTLELMRDLESLRF